MNVETLDIEKQVNLFFECDESLKRLDSAQASASASQRFFSDLDRMLMIIESASNFKATMQKEV